MHFEKEEIKIKQEKYEVPEAKTFLQKFIGLRLSKKEKMLFKFNNLVREPIDMFLVLKPLYLYFFDNEKKLISVEKAEPLTLNPKTWKIYRPKQKYQYLLESTEELNLKKGDKINIE